MTAALVTLMALTALISAHGLPRHLHPLQQPQRPQRQQQAQQPHGSQPAQQTRGSQQQRGAQPAQQQRVSQPPQSRGTQPAQQQRVSQQSQTERKTIEFHADFTRPVPGTDSVIRLTGNVVMYHNGAVLTCDSAYRFSEKHIECYGRVLINKDSTFIYGDRAVYDGIANIAQVFSPMVKVVDGDAVLYTFNFQFNTLDNIGKYWGRGTITQKENQLESVRGYYYSDKHEFVSVEQVEATDPEYKLASDSIRYNMDSERADFFTPTTVWNIKDEILSASRGSYYNADARYEFTRDTYILTPTREVICDSLDYDSRPADAVMRRNIQIRDDEQKIMAFGDYGQYWGGRENAMMTRDPSMVSFDPEQDTLYMRSDTIFLYSIAYELDFRAYDSLRRSGFTDIQIMDKGTKAEISDSMLMSHPDTELPVFQHEKEGVWPEPESSEMREALREMVVAQKSAFFEQGGAFTRESLTPEMIDSLLNTGYSSEDIEGQLLYNERKRELESQGLSMTDSLVYDILESIGAFGNPLPPTNQEVILDSLKKLEAEGKLFEGTSEDESVSRRESRRLKRADDAESTTDTEGMETAGTAGTAGATGDLAALAAEQKADTIPLRSILDKAGIDLDGLSEMVKQNDASALLDSLATTLREAGIDPQLLIPQILTLPTDSLFQTTAPAGSNGALSADPMTVDSVAVSEPVHDSLQRVILAYNNVRIYRNDMQAVCDSLVVLSKDSTAHLYIDPIMWNKQNQITAELIDIYTKNEHLERAFFSGWPLMISEVDSTQFNQIKGREMESFFRDDEIFKHIVTGNAQTLYYMIDEGSGEANTFLTVNSSSIVFAIEDQEITRISWFKDTDSAGYPIDKIPLDVNRFLDGFRWEIHRKPALKDVFNRIIKPSRREYYESLPLPMFPITDFIEKEKKRLTESGIWEDRVDTLPPHAIEFLHSIGVMR